MCFLTLHMTETDTCILSPRMEISTCVNDTYLHELHGDFVNLSVGVRGLEEDKVQQRHYVEGIVPGEKEKNTQHGYKLSWLVSWICLGWHT